MSATSSISMARRTTSTASSTNHSKPIRRQSSRSREITTASPITKGWSRWTRSRRRFGGQAGPLGSARRHPARLDDAARRLFHARRPLVSIIGLYSNSGKSFGWLDEPQLPFLYQELVRLKDCAAVAAGGDPRHPSLSALVSGPEAGGPYQYRDRCGLQESGLLAGRGNMRPRAYLSKGGAAGHRTRHPLYVTGAGGYACPRRGNRQILHGARSPVAARGSASTVSSPAMSAPR